MNTSKIDDIPIIIDYRIVNGYTDATEFRKKVLSYLKKGYTLQGFTKSIGPCLSQVIVKYSKPYGLIIQDYAVLGSTGSDMLQFERNVMDSLNDGWSLYGDHIYSKYESDLLFTLQAIVIYKKPTIIDDIDI